MKKCPKGKVLNPKTNRCIIDRNKKLTKKTTSKKECPPGKVLSPKGRCVIDRSKTSKKTNSKKECPPGKVLSPKGRCVIDRSKTSTKNTTSKKECPPGKVLSPKGRCVINRNKKVKKSSDNLSNRFSVSIKKRVLNSSWEGQPMDIIFGIVYLINKYNNLCSSIEQKYKKTIYYDQFCISYINRTNDKNNYSLTLPMNITSKQFSDRVYNCDKRFIIVPLEINFFNNGAFHLNIIIIDNLKKTIERFEPSKKNVERNWGTTIFNKLDKMLQKLLPKYKYFEPTTALYEYMFQDIEELHIKVGIKTPRQENDAEGYCAAWCIWYSEMRLKYHNLDRQDLIDRSIKILMKYKHSLRTFIRSYSYQLIKFRDNIIKKKHSNKNCKKNDYTGLVVDMPLKTFDCMKDFVLENYSL